MVCANCDMCPALEHCGRYASAAPQPQFDFIFAHYPISYLIGVKHFRRTTRYVELTHPTTTGSDFTTVDYILALKDRRRVRHADTVIRIFSRTIFRGLFSACFEFPRRSVCRVFFQRRMCDFSR